MEEKKKKRAYFNGFSKSMDKFQHVYHRKLI